MKIRQLRQFISILLYTVLTVFTATAQISLVNNIIHVKADAAGDGSSWTNAANLAAALQWAQANKDNSSPLWNSENPLKIYVAKGEHKPSIHPSNNQPGNNRIVSFLMVKNVQLYGGFDPDNGIVGLNDRRILPSIEGGSVLKGEAPNGEPVYHVLLSVGDVENALLDGFIITGAKAENPGMYTVNGQEIFVAKGGGVYNYYSSPSLTNVTISGNTAVDGGGVYNYFSSPSLTNVTISGNEAQFDGGGIHNISSSPNLTDVIINGNDAFKGGGIRNDSSFPNLTNVIINGNNAHIGGGMYNYFSSPNLVNVAVTKNIGTNSVGGIYNSSSSPNLVNTLISENEATFDGGMYNENSSPNLINVTISKNKKEAYSTAAGMRNNSSSYPKLYNSIVWGNIDDNGIVSNIRNDESVPEYFYCLVQGSRGSSNWNTDFGVDGGNNIDTDPRFVNSDNGNYNLTVGSPVINAGNNGVVTATKDLADNPRVRNNIVDMGAYEYQNSNREVIPPANNNNIIYVKEGASGNGTSWDTPADLAAVLQWAHANKNNSSLWNAENPLKIYVAKGKYKPSVNPGTNENENSRNVSFVMVKDVHIYGGFAGTEASLADRDLSNNENKSILSGDLDKDGRVSANDAFHVVISAGDVGTAQLNGFTICGGNSNGSGSFNLNGQTIYLTEGGGMYIRASSPVLSHLSIKGNNAGAGGGVFAAQSSSPQFSNVVVSGNLANSGGGIYSSSSSLTFRNATIVDNGGGGIYNEASSNLNIYNSIVWGNGIALSGGSSLVAYSILEGGYSGEGNKDSNPLFVSAHTNTLSPFTGGNYRLQASSPAINAGNNNYSSDDKDLVGGERIRDNTIDMGAYEFQMLMPILSGFTDIIKTFGDAEFELIAPTSNSDGVFTYTSSNTDIATVNGNTITIVGAGTTEITAIQASTANYKAGEIKLTLTVEEKTLPVSLIEFTAKATHNHALLTWQTSSESNNKEYIVSRSTDGVKFTELYKIAGKGNSNLVTDYNYSDRSPANGTNYYKLTQVDNSGTATELGVRALVFSLSTLGLKVYPNPTNNMANLTFEPGKYHTLTITDQSGKTIHKAKVNPTEGRLSISLVNYPNGIYLLNLIGNTGKVTEKVLKK